MILAVHLARTNTILKANTCHNFHTFTRSEPSTCIRLIHKSFFITRDVDPSHAPKLFSSMLWSTPRALLRRIHFLGPVSSFLLSRQILSHKRQALLFSSQVSLVSSLSPPIKTGLLGPVLCDLHSVRAMASQSTKSTVHDFTVKDAKGNDVDLSQYKGKTLLIVNVASQCGLTNSNYTELSQVYGKYKDQGLEILAFPCNQFGAQEPGNNEQILEFACTRFKAEYPIFDKVDVNGKDAAPLYKFLKSSKGGLFGDNIKWNFSKFLVDKDGNVVDRYAPTTSPLSIEKDIKKLLGTA